jgi:hypothetical protein
VTHTGEKEGLEKKGKAIKKPNRKRGKGNKKARTHKRRILNHSQFPRAMVRRGI